MVYIINDWHDRASDALHPTKRHRPLASGAVAVPVALVLAGLLLVAGLLLAAGNRTLLVLLAAYVLLNLAYSLAAQAGAGGRRVHHRLGFHAAPAGRHGGRRHPALALAAADRHFLWALFLGFPNARPRAFMRKPASAP